MPSSQECYEARRIRVIKSVGNNNYGGAEGAREVKFSADDYWSAERVRIVKMSDDDYYQADEVVIVKMSRDLLPPGQVDESVIHRPTACPQ